MAKRGGAVHVTTHRRHYVGKDGAARDYETHLLRRSWREGGKVRNETVANLSHLPSDLISVIGRSLAGEAFVPASAAATVTRSVPHGHVAAVCAQAVALGLPALLGPAGRHRDLAMALIVARVVHPGSKLATASWWDDTSLGVELDVAGASTDEVYAAMDWLLGRQDAIEAKLATRHLAAEANPSRMALFDLSSSWMEGTCCPLAKRGYSRDGKKNRTQIEYGLLTDPAGRPVAIKVFAGNTGDPTAFIDAVKIVREKVKLTEMVMAGAVAAGRLVGADQIGLKVGKIWNTYKMAKHFAVTITDTTLALTRRTAQIEAEAALDGIYVIRTTVPPDTLDAAGVVGAYKNLAHVERDFRTIKVDDLDLRPIYHRLEDRVRAHVFIVMLAAYLTWHLRKTLAPLTFTDETPPARVDPVAPAERSAAATRKASRRKDHNDQPVRSFRALLDHLGTLTRNDVRISGTKATIAMLAEPTPTQQRAFELIGTIIPVKLT